MDPTEAAQLQNRARDGRFLVTDVELDDLVGGPRPVFVRDVRPDRQRVTGRPRMPRSSRSWSIVKQLYDRPCPNGQSGATEPST